MVLNVCRAGSGDWRAPIRIRMQLARLANRPAGILKITRRPSFAAFACLVSPSIDEWSGGRSNLLLRFCLPGGSAAESTKTAASCGTSESLIMNFLRLAPS